MPLDLHRKPSRKYATDTPVQSYRNSAVRSILPDLDARLPFNQPLPPAVAPGPWEWSVFGGRKGLTGGPGSLRAPSDIFEVQSETGSIRSSKKSSIRSLPARPKPQFSVAFNSSRLGQTLTIPEVFEEASPTQSAAVSRSSSRRTTRSGLGWRGPPLDTWTPSSVPKAKSTKSLISSNGYNLSKIRDSESNINAQRRPNEVVAPKKTIHISSPSSTQVPSSSQGSSQSSEYNDVNAFINERGSSETITSVESNTGNKHEAKTLDPRETIETTEKRENNIPVIDLEDPDDGIIGRSETSTGMKDSKHSLPKSSESSKPKEKLETSSRKPSPSREQKEITIEIISSNSRNPTETVSPVLPLTWQQKIKHLDNPIHTTETIKKGIHPTSHSSIDKWSLSSKFVSTEESIERHTSTERRLSVGNDSRMNLPGNIEEEASSKHSLDSEDVETTPSQNVRDRYYQQFSEDQDSISELDSQVEYHRRARSLISHKSHSRFSMRSLPSKVYASSNQRSLDIFTSEKQKGISMLALSLSAYNSARFRYNPNGEMTLDKMLTFGTVPYPIGRLAPDHVQVEVFSVAFDTHDFVLLKEKSSQKGCFGFIPGRSFFGRVLRCGVEVVSVEQGDFVYGLLSVETGGAASEVVVTSEKHVTAAPDGVLSTEELSAVPLYASYAIQIMESLCYTLPRGAKILVLNADRGIGDLCIQLVRHYRPYNDLSIVAQCCPGNTKGATTLISSGLSVVIDTVPNVMASQRSDSYAVVLDLTEEGIVYNEADRLLQKSGILVSIERDWKPSLDQNQKKTGIFKRLSKNTKAITIWRVRINADFDIRECLEKIKPAILSQTVNHVVTRVLEFNQAPQAFINMGAIDGTVIKVK